jgi:hypothetical protein
MLVALRPALQNLLRQQRLTLERDQAACVQMFRVQGPQPHIICVGQPSRLSQTSMNFYLSQRQASRQFCSALSLLEAVAARRGVRATAA